MTPLDVGSLVVLAGEVGVWRIERWLSEGRVARCFSYATGAIVTVDVAAISPCPDNALAQAPPPTVNE